jgi:hypothetical protein
MTSYAGMGRTNTFRVNDTAAVKALLEPAFTVLERDAGAPGAVTIFSDEDGDWQRTLFADDDDQEGTDIYVPDWIVDHLQPGETAISVHTTRDNGTSARSASPCTPTAARSTSTSTRSTSAPKPSSASPASTSPATDSARREVESGSTTTE